jgi:hypothetical protein
MALPFPDPLGESVTEIPMTGTFRSRT